MDTLVSKQMMGAVFAWACHSAGLSFRGKFKRTVEFDRDSDGLMYRLSPLLIPAAASPTASCQRQHPGRPASRELRVSFPAFPAFPLQLATTQNLAMAQIAEGFNPKFLQAVEIICISVYLL